MFCSTWSRRGVAVFSRLCLPISLQVHRQAPVPQEDALHRPSQTGPCYASVHHRLKVLLSAAVRVTKGKCRWMLTLQPPARLRRHPFFHNTDIQMHAAQSPNWLHISIEEFFLKSHHLYCHKTQNWTLHNLSFDLKACSHQKRKISLTIFHTNTWQLSVYYKCALLSLSL